MTGRHENVRERGGRRYDVLVVGAGVAGCCLARELARYRLRCVVLEAGNDIACGATRANSGIVHAGFDPLPGSLKAHYNIEGSRLFPQWAEELDFRYSRNGALVLAFDEDDLAVLRELEQRARQNGVDDFAAVEKLADGENSDKRERTRIERTRIISAEELFELEPQVSPKAQAALLAPSAAICDPYGLAFSAAENAVQNGIDFLFKKRVVSVEKITQGSFERLADEELHADSSGEPVPSGAFRVVCEDGDIFKADAVVNAAGLYADELNNMLSERKLQTTPVRGEYLLYEVAHSGSFRHTMFQTPNERGKGVLAVQTVHGNQMIGPNAVLQADKEDLSTTAEGMGYLLEAARKTWPGASYQGVSTSFAGLRARGNTGDFVIGEAPDVPGFFNIACFESPGLTAAPAVAVDVAGQVAGRLGASLRSDFESRRIRAIEGMRHPVPLPFSLMDDGQRALAIAENPQYGRIVCRCRNVTEAEIVTELHGLLPVLSLDALKWRTGIMMGPCNGGFCMPELLDIFVRETGLLPEKVDKRLPGSPLLVSSNPEFARRSKAGMRVEHTTIPASPPLSASSEYDVIVIGGGAAGIAAATSARREGADKVLLIDRENALGGILKQCIHNGFGLHRYKEELTGPEYAAREIEALTSRCDTAGTFRHDIEIMKGATVFKLEPAPETSDTRSVPAHVVQVVSPAGLLELRAKSIVLATGSRERGVGALVLPGSRPAGVFSAGSAQNFVNLRGGLPGRRVVILGSGDIGLIMARRMHFQGAEVLGVYARRKQVAGLRRNVVQCLDDFGIPLFLGRTITRLEGKNRLEAVYTSEVDQATMRLVPGTEKRVACDTLLLSVGLLPENEVAKTVGIGLDSLTGGALVDNRLETDVAGIFACGNALHIHDLADYVSEEGDLAGKSAARRAQGFSQGIPQGFSQELAMAPAVLAQGGIPVVAGDGIRYAVPQRIDPTTPSDQELRLFIRVSKPLKNARIALVGIDVEGRTHTIRRMKVRIAVPAEMLRIRFKTDALLSFEQIVLRAESGGKPDGEPDGKSVAKSAAKVDAKPDAKSAARSDVKSDAAHAIAVDGKASGI